jgi:HK97 family phage portal protein
MSILRRILPGGENRALSRIGGFLPFDRVPSLGNETDVQAAMNLTAYNAGIRLLADTVSTLPIDSYIRRDGVRYPYRPKPIWLTQPDPRNSTQTIQSLISQAIVSLYTNGNTFIATLRSSDGEVQELRVLNPERVQVKRGADGTPEYTVNNGAESVVVGPDEIKHIPLLRMPGEERGIDLLRANAQAIRTGLSIENYANAYFENGANPSGVVKIPAEQKREVTEALKEQLNRAQTGSKRWSMLLLTGGADFQEFRGVDPEQTQLLASRTFTVLQICRLLRIPPSMLSVTDPGAMSYASVEQQTLAFVRDTVRPLASLLESALGTLIINPDAFVRFGLEGLLRGASADRASFYTQLLQQGIISTNEARALEDLRPIDGGDNYRMPLNEAPSMAVADSRARADVLDKLVASGVPLDQARKIAGI